MVDHISRLTMECPASSQTAGCRKSSGAIRISRVDGSDPHTADRRFQFLSIATTETIPLVALAYLTCMNRWYFSPDVVPLHDERLFVRHDCMRPAGSYTDLPLPHEVHTEFTSS
jgi:hypothetical protein